jgi:hypothetical protein
MTKDYEHHCSYVNNCIGEQNRRVFVSFLIACFVGICTFTYLALSIDTYVLCPNKEKFWVRLEYISPVHCIYLSLIMCLRFVDLSVCIL